MGPILYFRTREAVAFPSGLGLVPSPEHAASNSAPTGISGGQAFPEPCSYGPSYRPGRLKIHDGTHSFSVCQPLTFVQGITGLGAARPTESNCKVRFSII